ncbi:MAG: SDR family NAD(P)-dependent oxidoreductase [Bacteriovoracia bacterium]
MKRRILITGGTGFLGQRLAKVLAPNWEVTICGRNNKLGQLAEKATGARCIPMDVANIESVRDAFREARPQAVIHAAATKFVDLSEKQPMECVDINVLGSQNVARAAMDYGIETVIGISTDKAAPPIRNIYGMSKATMERMFCALDSKGATRFLCVRYGNVAWSTGSVLPIWKKMHEENGVLRSTGPEMTRFFFTIEEAVQLVVTALDNAQRFRGRVLSREMKAAKVESILNNWVNEKGGRWEKMEGRPGDRTYECLIGEQELEYTEQFELGGVVHYSISFNDKAKNPPAAVVSSDSALRLTENEISALLRAIPPEAL